ncbi:CBS domain-containing protein [Aneurinibacillus tyrosinisolvens]|uniref:CBS domain-containing protein n=1 Tax=Aneurinibacillus tyrosinisolvens TaxID=1443435 RepID=UPI00069A82F9|nr:CBS domain-containing protein [Aneurinibacillus tyrosinisolvens]
MKERVKETLQSNVLLALESSSDSHGFETYPYRKKVGELMDSPVLSVPPGTGIIPAAQLMMEKQISSLLVMEDGQAEGIITERDLMKLIPSYNKIPLLSVSDIMSRQVITIREDALSL